MLEQPPIRTVLYHLASGNAFYTSVLLIGLAVVGSFVAGASDRRSPRLPRLAATVGVIGLVTTAASLTLTWLLAIVAGLAVGFMPRLRRPVRLTLAVVAVAALLLATAATWRYETAAPPPAGNDDRPLVVLGDSLTADRVGDPTWPHQLAERLGRPLISHARPGARLRHGLATLDRDPPRRALVVVLLGGNDILDDAARADYAADLDTLLARLNRHDNTVILIELPTPPSAPWHGWSQRRLAQRHGVHLVPRRLLSRTLFAEPAATSDGLHLTQHGHDHLAHQLHHHLTR